MTNLTSACDQTEFRISPD